MESKSVSSRMSKVVFCGSAMPLRAYICVP